MADMTISITAPEDLILLVIEAYAADAGLPPDAGIETRQNAAIDAILDELRLKVVQHVVYEKQKADQSAQAELADTTESTIKGRRNEVAVKINDQVTR
jgi:hypothetical protein